MEPIKFESNEAAQKYIENTRKRLIDILEKIDPTFDKRFDSDNCDGLFNRVNKVLNHNPITKEKETFIREVFNMEINIIHITEVFNKNKDGFDTKKGIDTVELDPKPILPITDGLKPERPVDRAKLQAEDDAYRSLFEQNARRHALGSKDAAGFGPVK